MDASYPPPSQPQSPPPKKKNLTWIVVAAAALLIVGSYFVARALKPAAVGKQSLHTTNLPGLTIDLPGGKVVKESKDGQSGEYRVQQIGLQTIVVSVGWSPGSEMDETEARNIGQQFVDGMKHDDGELTDTHQRQIGGHDGWITVGHGGMLATATLSWYCPENHRVIHVLIGTNAGADQAAQLADRIADSVHCHVVDDSSAGSEPSAP